MQGEVDENMKMYEPVLKIYDSFHAIYHQDYMGSKYDQYNLIWGLVEYIEEKTGRLVFEGRDMNCNDIAKVVKKKKEKVAAIVTDMITNGVILAFDNAYYINPVYIVKVYVTEKGEGISCDTTSPTKK